MDGVARIEGADLTGASGGKRLLKLASAVLSHEHGPRCYGIMAADGGRYGSADPLCVEDT